MKFIRSGRAKNILFIEVSYSPLTEAEGLLLVLTLLISPSC